MAGISGNVRVGMDMGLLKLRIQGKIGQQAYLIESIFVGGVFAVWLMGLAAKAIAQLLSYAVRLAAGRADGDDRSEKLLVRDDEVGHLARLFLDLSEAKGPNKVERATAARPDPDMSGALGGCACLNDWTTSYGRRRMHGPAFSLPAHRHGCGRRWRDRGSADSSSNEWSRLA